MSGTVLALIAQGSKRLALGDRVYEYRAGEYLVASVDLPVIGHFTEASPELPALGFGLILQPSAVAELLLQAIPGDISPAGSVTPPGIVVSDASDELIDAVVRLLRLLDHPRDATVLAPLIKREIPLATRHRRARRRRPPARPCRQQPRPRRPGRPLDPQPLLAGLPRGGRRAAVSLSAFYRNFQAVTAMSPIQFQKRVRLQEARLLLATHPNDVTGVGQRVGYDSPSQFSREYRRQFGAPPSQDAARLRGSPLSAAPTLP
jgi:AraC-like DNA-binding protein